MKNASFLSSSLICWMLPDDWLGFEFFLWEVPGGWVELLKISIVFFLNRRSNKIINCKKDWKKGQKRVNRWTSLLECFVITFETHRPYDQICRFLYLKNWPCTNANNKDDGSYSMKWVKCVIVWTVQWLLLSCSLEYNSNRFPLFQYLFFYTYIYYIRVYKFLFTENTI